MRVERGKSLLRQDLYFSRLVHGSCRPPGPSLVWASAELGTWGALWMWYAAGHMPSPILECTTLISPLDLALKLSLLQTFAQDLCVASPGSSAPHSRSLPQRSLPLAHGTRLLSPPRNTVVLFP